MEIGGADRAELGHWLRAQSIPQALATRARIVLGSAAGESVRGLAVRLGVTQTTVCLWRRRYRSAGLAGLRTKSRAGRPRRISAAKEQAVISATLRKPKAATYWSARRLAKQVGLSAATVHRLWQKYGLQPHRTETFKFSRDPQFDASVRRVEILLEALLGRFAGIHRAALNPLQPDRAAVAPRSAHKRAPSPGSVTPLQRLRAARLIPATAAPAPGMK